MSEWILPSTRLPDVAPDQNYYADSGFLRSKSVLVSMKGYVFTSHLAGTLGRLVWQDEYGEGDVLSSIVDGWMPLPDAAL